MKKVLFIAVAAMLSLSTFAQKPLEFSKVIQVEGVESDVLFSSIVQWIGSRYYNVGNDDFISDKQAGYIIKQAAIPFVKTGFYQCYSGTIIFKMKFQFKDGRYRVVLSDFSHIVKTSAKCTFNGEMGLVTDAEDNPLGGGISKSAHNKVWKEIQEACKEKADKVFAELEKIDYKAADSNNDDDDW
ncbi:MAG TPA: DUF4468 domain-containing protein [Paludibacter sp.]|nr:DUF4468 domain-containing protein [Paludibacter sp.]